MKTQRVRIAVAMSRDGEHWSAQGWPATATAEAHDKGMANCVLDRTGYPADVHFIEVDIPVPEIHTTPLQGKVVPGSDVR